MPACPLVPSRIISTTSTTTTPAAAAAAVHVPQRNGGVPRGSGQKLPGGAEGQRRDLVTVVLHAGVRQGGEGQSTVNIGKEGRKEGGRARAVFWSLWYYVVSALGKGAKGVLS